MLQCTVQQSFRDIRASGGRGYPHGIQGPWSAGRSYLRYEFESSGEPCSRNGARYGTGPQTTTGTPVARFYAVRSTNSVARLMSRFDLVASIVSRVWLFLVAPRKRRSTPLHEVLPVRQVAMITLGRTPGKGTPKRRHVTRILSWRDTCCRQGYSGSCPLGAGPLMSVGGKHPLETRPEQRQIALGILDPLGEFLL